MVGNNLPPNAFQFLRHLTFDDDENSLEPQYKIRLDGVGGWLP
jgi:hypothetical protein